MKRRSLTILLLLLLALPSMAARTAAGLFATGRALIDDNCADCQHATRHGLEAGIEAVKQALDGGFTDHVAAYKALAVAYNTLALVHAAPDSDEQREVRTLQHAAYDRLVELAPGDAEVRLQYALFLREPAARLVQAEAAARLAPRSAEARFVHAMALIDAERVDEALTEARATIAVARQSAVERYALHLGERLELAGRASEAEQLRGEARRKTK